MAWVLSWRDSWFPPELVVQERINHKPQSLLGLCLRSHTASFLQYVIGYTNQPDSGWEESARGRNPKGCRALRTTENDYYTLRSLCLALGSPIIHTIGHWILSWSHWLCFFNLFFPRLHQIISLDLSLSSLSLFSAISILLLSPSSEFLTWVIVFISFIYLLRLLKNLSICLSLFLKHGYHSYFKIYLLIPTFLSFEVGVYWLSFASWDFLVCWCTK